MKQLLRAFGLMATLIAPLIAPMAAADEGFTLTGIRAHLFHELSGTLSDDIIATRPTLFNTIIGEGDAAEPASNFLVVITMTGPADAMTETPLTIRVESDREGWHVVAERSFDFLYTLPGNLQIARGVWVEDATCGTARVTATHGKDRQVAEIPFVCRE